MKKVTVMITLDAKSQEEKKSIFLAVRHERKTRQYSLGINTKLTKQEFDNPRLKITKDALEQARPYQVKAESIIKDLGDDFSFIKFKERFKGKNKVIDNASKEINDVFAQYIQGKKDLRQGTIDSYKSIINHINNFKHGIKITDLDVDMILKLQEHIRRKHRKEHGKELSETTMDIYMRALRAIYNYAQTKFNLPREHYPFGSNKIVIHSSESSHRAMSDDDFTSFISYKPNNKNEEFAHDMFLISYGLVGMNYADIFNLKNKNIKYGSTLEFIREKTKDRTTKRIVINMIIEPKILALISKYAAIVPEAPDDYIFPFYNKEMTEKQKLRKRKGVTKAIDKSLKTICSNIGIPQITTYWARHTIATNLYNAGRSAEVISKLLGHADIKTTNTYLGQLGLRKQEEVASDISSFLEDLEIGAAEESKEDLERFATEPILHK